MQIKKYYTSIGLLSILCSQYTFGFSIRQGQTIFQAGASFNTSGKTQNIYIQNTLGDRFSVNSQHSQSYLLGLAYLLEGGEKDRYRLDYGLNVFYLGDSSVKGSIYQEFRYDNLAYQYHIQHLPIYAVVKATDKNYFNDRFSLTLDAGIGPSINFTNRFSEWAINGSNSIADPLFKSKTNVTFSAMVGPGVKINRFYKDKPLECGYRFYYLGNSEFNIPNNQWLTSLKTGASYTQAALCSISL
jgi:hypothetical protein